MVESDSFENCVFINNCGSFFNATVKFMSKPINFYIHFIIF